MATPRTNRTKAGHATGPEAATSPVPRHAQNPLDNPEEQAKILRPEPAALTIAGKPVQLYPLSARRQGQFVGFYTELMIEAGKRASANASAMGARLIAVLKQDDELMDKFAKYVARSLSPADQFVPETQVAELAEQVYAAKFNETTALFAALSEINNIAEEFGSPN